MKHADGYMTVEAALILPISFFISLLVIRLWFFRYDCVLQEMDAASIVVRTLEQQDLNADEKAEYVISEIQGRYKEHYILWSFGEVRTLCTADSVECTLSGECGGMPGAVYFGEPGDSWVSSVTRSRRNVSEVFVIRAYRKVLEAGKELSGGE